MPHRHAPRAGAGRGSARETGSLRVTSSDTPHHVKLPVGRREVDGRARAVVLRPEVRVGVHDLRSGARAAAPASARRPVCSPVAPRTYQLQLLRVTQADARVEGVRLETRLRRVPAGAWRAAERTTSGHPSGTRAAHAMACRAAPPSSRTGHVARHGCCARNDAAWRQIGRRVALRFRPALILVSPQSQVGPVGPVRKRL